jgi:surface antigen
MVAACSPQGTNGRTPEGDSTFGAILGGIGGAILGSQFGEGSGKIAATAAGTLLGAAIGSQLANRLNEEDVRYYNTTSQRALETGQPGETLPWSNPNTNAKGTITPQNYYQTAQGQYCREYQQTITVGGETAQGYGTACRQPDGDWEIQN